MPGIAVDKTEQSAFAGTPASRFGKPDEQTILLHFPGMQYHLGNDVFIELNSRPWHATDALVNPYYLGDQDVGIISFP